MNVPSVELDDDEVVVEWFRKSYKCSACGETWSEKWSCMCNDHCPGCDAETEPTSCIDLSRPVTAKDYSGAARLISRKTGEASPTITPEDAKAYAEAMLEGGEHRFCPPRWHHPLK